MTVIAIIGADGAGKSTVARALEASLPFRTKYIYMGSNIESSNIALPTSRLILYLKRLSFRRVAKREGITDPTRGSSVGRRWLEIRRWTRRLQCRLSAS